jgi:hypothetical protein
MDETSKLEQQIEELERKLAAQNAVVEAAKVAADKLFEAITLRAGIDDKERAAYKGLVAAVNAYCKKHCEECLG